ncbi:hypothetical protein BVRB_7g177150 [Beta vulgaris subsp. vulgaris]|nr:hypothetical protein BVRB_7g177150 [Beta vulgaris subsp. vulgaris]
MFENKCCDLDGNASWTVVYTKTKMMDVARITFEGTPDKAVVFWTAMICGCSQNGLPNEALMNFGEFEVHHMLSLMLFL